MKKRKTVSDLNNFFICPSLKAREIFIGQRKERRKQNSAIVKSRIPFYLRSSVFYGLFYSRFKPPTILKIVKIANLVNTRICGFLMVDFRTGHGNATEG